MSKECAVITVDIELSVQITIPVGVSPFDPNHNEAKSFIGLMEVARAILLAAERAAGKDGCRMSSAEVKVRHFPHSGEEF